MCFGRPSILASMPARLQFALQQILELLDVAFALGTAHFERRRDVLVVARLQIAERGILQLPFHLPDAEPVCERRVDLAGLDREFSLQHGIERLRGAHSLQLLGQPHHDQANIADDRHQHLSQRLGLRRLEAPLRGPIGRQAELSQLAQGSRQSNGLLPEALHGALPIEKPLIEERTQQCGDDHIVVGIERAHDLGHIERRAAQGLGLGGHIERAHGRKARLELRARGPGWGGGFHGSDGRVGGFKRPLPVSYSAMPDSMTKSHVQVAVSRAFANA